MEKLMKEICKNTNSNEYSALMLAYFFWQVTDYIFHSNKADIFKHLYLSPKHFKDNYLKISMEHNINIRTLERYRKIFVISFEATLMLLKTNSVILKVV